MSMKKCACAQSVAKLANGVTTFTKRIRPKGSTEFAQLQTKLGWERGEHRTLATIQEENQHQ